MQGRQAHLGLLANGHVRHIIRGEPGLDDQGGGVRNNVHQALTGLDDGALKEGRKPDDRTRHRRPDRGVGHLLLERQKARGQL